MIIMKTTVGRHLHRWPTGEYVDIDTTDLDKTKWDLAVYDAGGKRIGGWELDRCITDDLLFINPITGLTFEVFQPRGSNSPAPYISYGRLGAE